MRRSHVFLLLLIVASIALFLYSCSSKPTAQMQRAEAARQEAVDEHADQFAPDDWSAAEKAWQDASEQINAGSYGQAGTLLLKAQTRYQKARDIAKGKREVAINQIKRQQQDATARLELLKNNPAVKKLSTARKKAFDERVKEIEDNIAKVSEQLNNAQYSEANLLAGKAFRDVYEAEQEFLK